MRFYTQQHRQPLPPQGPRRRRRVSLLLVLGRRRAPPTSGNSPLCPPSAQAVRTGREGSMIREPCPIQGVCRSKTGEFPISWCNTVTGRGNTAIRKGVAPIPIGGLRSGWEGFPSRRARCPSGSGGCPSTGESLRSRRPTRPSGSGRLPSGSESSGPDGRVSHPARRGARLNEEGSCPYDSVALLDGCVAEALPDPAGTCSESSDRPSQRSQRSPKTGNRLPTHKIGFRTVSDPLQGVGTGIRGLGTISKASDSNLKPSN